MMCVVQVKELLNKVKTFLQLNEQGILSKITPNIKKIGFVDSSDVQTIKIVKFMSNQFVGIVTINPEKYLARLNL